MDKTIKTNLADLDARRDAERKYHAFIAQIDGALYTKDCGQTLPELIDNDSQENASDTVDGTWDEVELEYWEVALRTAEMRLDTWQECYPEVLRRSGNDQTYEHIVILSGETGDSLWYGHDQNINDEVVAGCIRLERAMLEDRGTDAEPRVIGYYVGGTLDQKEVF
tara:strand:- start:154 stop:651 length:498 start_codon:yes stop_codon:yes gene_type:complete